MQKKNQIFDKKFFFFCHYTPKVGYFFLLFFNLISRLIIVLKFPFETMILYDDFHDIIVYEFKELLIYRNLLEI